MRKQPSKTKSVFIKSMKKLAILVLLLLTVLQFSACWSDNSIDKESSESVLITESKNSIGVDSKPDSKDESVDDEESLPEGNPDGSAENDESGKWTGVHKP